MPESGSGPASRGHIAPSRCGATAAHGHPDIFEATIQHRGVLVRVDILERRAANRWRLIEVKSSPDVKEYHLYDVAIQAHVLRGCGLDLSSCCLMHLNRDYVYDGRPYDPKDIFTIRNVTAQIRKLTP